VWVIGVLLTLAIIGSLLPDDAPQAARPTPVASDAPATDEPSATATSSPTPEPEDDTNANVTRVVDGDTIKATFQGALLTVRLIGVDTPETVHPSEPVECFGPAASKYTTQALEGERVRLEFDVERLDQYGRTLAYVWLGERLFNEKLVRDGYANVSTFPPNVKYVDRFRAAQRDARSHDRGLWGRCAEEPPLSPSPSPQGTPPPNCTSGYSPCLPLGPSDYDCAGGEGNGPAYTEPGVTYQVTGSDPYGLDGSDNDGLGCE
jgi:endonuclease YncB( thermonuclease family)